MENNNIKVHPPWYARGTPIINTRDGPPMALSDKPLFAIRGGPSARGKVPEKYRPWLTLRKINAVKSLDVDRLEERSADDVVFDLSAYAVPDNVKMDEGDVKMEDRSEERSADDVDLDFDLSAYAVPDNVKMDEGDVKMEDGCEERSADDFDFDLSAYAVPDNVKMDEGDVKMEDRLKERSAVIVDADRSMDAVRSEERSADDFDFDLSAYAVPDNVKMVDDNVKMEEGDVKMDDNVKIFDDHVKMELECIL